MRTCSYEGCSKVVKARGMCKGHYERWIYHHPEASTGNEGYRAAILAALPATRAEIEVKAGCHKETAWRWITKLKGKEIRICGWQGTKPIYGRGTEPDAPYNYKAIPESVISKRWRRRNKEILSLKQKAKRAAQKAIRTPQTWFSALGAA